MSENHAAPVVIGGKTLISKEQAAQLLGLKPASLATTLSRGELPLTRYYRGRQPSFDLAEVERFIISNALPAGQRKRGR